MRLINTLTLELQDFFSSIVPEYAILSHTWGEDEVTFQDMASPNRTSKKGWHKITETCRIAREHSLDFAWVDTCSIDKSSSAELTESINSMFQWYENARICYVFLEDTSAQQATVQGLGSCRWFTRGWTLQELLASRKMLFFDKTWSNIGSTPELDARITSYTDIPLEVLRSKNLSAWSVASKMSWAARRRTTRIEDEAYSLLGIFGVSMPLIYGEGRRAFRRLQEEIVKRSNDLTIFAWETEPYSVQKSLFASSPAAFTSGSSWARPFRNHFPEFSVTNKGLLVSSHLSLRVRTRNDDREAPCYLLMLGSHQNQDQKVGIYLQKTGPSLFFRDGSEQTAWFKNKDLQADWRKDDQPSYHIVIDWVTGSLDRSLAFVQGALHIPEQADFTLDWTVPDALWDTRRRTFLKPNPTQSSRYNMVVAMHFTGRIARTDVQLVVLCDYIDGQSLPECHIFRREDYAREACFLLHGSRQNHSIDWVDFEYQVPILARLGNSLSFEIEHQAHVISAVFKNTVDNDYNGGAEVFSLTLEYRTGKRKRE